MGGDFRVRRIVFVAVYVLFTSALTLGLMEVALRIRPELISLDLLLRFQEEVALDVAKRRRLPNRSQVWELDRDDGGPPLKLFKPFTEIEVSYRDPEALDLMRLDANGFCNPLPDGGYGAESIDIITLGDSFTWCLAVAPEDIWTYRLAGFLDRPAYCLGRGGVGPYEYVQILKRFGLPKSPDIVVMNVYGGNDLRDSLQYRSFVEAAVARDASNLMGDRRAPVDNFLGRRSYAFNLVATAATAGVEAAGNTIQRRRLGQSKVNFRYSLHFREGVVGFNFSNTDRNEVRHAVALSKGTISLDVFDAALAEFAELSGEHGFLPVVAFTPSAHTVYAEWAVFEDPAIEKPLAEFSRAQREYFARSSRELGFVFADGTPALQKAAAKRRGDELLYFQWNLHYTSAGHQVLAREIAAAIDAARP
jgi:hypothetical protein